MREDREETRPQHRSSSTALISGWISPMNRVSRHRLGQELVVCIIGAEGHSHVGNGALTALGSTRGGRCSPATQLHAGSWSLGVSRVSHRTSRGLPPLTDSGIPGPKRGMAGFLTVTRVAAGARGGQRQEHPRYSGGDPASELEKSGCA
jgi:hypothetical protein